MNHADDDESTPMFSAAQALEVRSMRLLLEAGAIGKFHNRTEPLQYKWWLLYQYPVLVETVVKLLLAAGADVNRSVLQMCISVVDSVPPFVRRLKGMKVFHLMYAAGQEEIRLKVSREHHHPNIIAADMHDKDPKDHSLRNQCRKVIRKHLLTMDPHTNLFIRVLQLQGEIPEELVSYLLYYQSLEVNWEEYDKAWEEWKRGQKRRFWWE